MGWLKILAELQLIRCDSNEKLINFRPALISVEYKIILHKLLSRELNLNKAICQQMALYFHPPTTTYNIQI